MKRMQYATVSEDGSMLFPTQAAAQFGLKPGQRVAFVENGNHLILSRPTNALNRLYIEPTNRCNLTCITCMRNIWDEPLGNMSPAVFERLLADLGSFSPPPNVFFGGIGEPLFHPDIADMVEKAKAVAGHVELITNGMLLTEKIIKRFIEAELDILWVSIDGATPQSYLDVRLGDNLPLVLDNLKRLRAIRDQAYKYYPQLGIAFVAMQRNIADLPEVVRIGASLGVKRFSVTNVLAHTPELRGESLYEQSLYRGAYAAADILPRISMPRMDINEMTQGPLIELMRLNYPMLVGDNAALQVTETCPFVERGSAVVRWDGALSPCLPLLHTHDSILDDRPRRSHAHLIGNIMERTLAELWNDGEYTALRETLQAFAFSPCVYCNSCEWANENLEDCFGNILPTCGGCLWAQGLIQCP
jgi:MoaA/NifB/PqqE/SkfB family radical SAM enzyme